jgi:hypothetical protein
LLYIIHTTEHGYYFQTTVLGKLASFIGDLEHQLPGRGKDQYSGCAWFSFYLEWIFQYPVDYSNQKCSSLSSTGLSPAAGILAGQSAGKNFSLYRCTVLEAQIEYGMKQRVGKIEIVKSGPAFYRWNLEL